MRLPILSPEPLRVPLRDLLERAFPAEPVIVTAARPATMTASEEDATRCPGCGETARSRSRHAPGCPEVLPGHAEEDDQ